MSDSSDTILAFCIGAVIGGVTALLMTPRSGPETRDQLRRGMDDLRARSQTAASQTRDVVETKAGEYRERVRGAVEGAREGARSRVEAVREAASEAKETYQREMESES
jgi:gas vesicle protein